MYPLTKYSTIIFDIGDVLFSWSSKTDTGIPSQTLRRILASPTWFEYERGRISQDVCYDRVASQFSLDPAEIRKAFDQARDSMQCNEQMIDLIRELKSQSQGLLRIFAMSNISFPDYEVLRTKPADWSLFDHIFTSAAAGQRKPNLSFYKQVLAETNVDPRSAIFLDDKSENVLSARSLGFHGIVFDSTEKVVRSLRNLTGDPVKRGRNFLNNNAGRLDSVTGTGVTLLENFAQLLLLEATNDR
jgi:FMN phosphatase YigB (HAD superfamily)